VFLLFFFLRDGDGLLARARRLIPLDERAQRAPVPAIERRDSRHRRRTSVTALLQGALVGIGFTIASLPSPVVFGVLAALLSMLPVGGAALVWGPAAIWLFVDGRWGFGIFMLAWGLLLSGLDNVLRPILIPVGENFGAGRVHRRAGRHSGVRRDRHHWRPGSAFPGARPDRIRRGKPRANLLSAHEQTRAARGAS